MNDTIHNFLDVFYLRLFELRKGNLELDDRDTSLHNYVALSHPLFYLKQLIYVN